MWCKFRHKIVVEIVRPIFWLFFKLRYNCSTKKEKTPEEGSIIISNHLMTLDPFLLGLKFNKPLYYMASSDLFQNKFTGKLIKFLVNPIPKQKSNKSDIGAIKACLQVAKENGNICIFPEGNRSFSGKLGNIDFSITKLIKKIRKPLIICNVLGGYGSDPRWCKKTRKGKLEVIIRNTYSVDELDKMTNEELYSLIREQLCVDEMGLNVEFKGKNIAEDLEKVFHICPICKQEHNLHSKGNKLVCHSCGNKFIYNPDLTLSCDDPRFKFKHIHEWYDYQIEEMKSKLYFDNNIIYQDVVELYLTHEGKAKDYLDKGCLKLFNSYFLFDFTKKKVKIDFDEIDAITILGNRKMNIYTKNGTYQVKINGKTNLLKYMHLFYILKNKKEGITDGFIGI